MSGGIWHGGLLPGGYLSGGICPGGICPGGICPRTTFLYSLLDLMCNYMYTHYC